MTLATVCYTSASWGLATLFAVLLAGALLVIGRLMRQREAADEPTPTAPHGVIVRDGEWDWPGR